MSVLSRSRRRSSASLVLERHGVSQHKLADVLGVSTSSLSRTLGGLQPVPNGFELAIRTAVGKQALAEVLAAISEAGS